MNFRRWVVFTFLIHALVVVVDKGGGIILYLLTATEKSEHGKAGIAASLPFILGAIANLGLATALVYFVRRKKVEAQVAFQTSMWVAVVWGGLVGAAACVITLWGLPMINPAWQMEWWGVVPICAVVPFLLIASYANSTQLATDRVKDYGIVHLATSVSFLPAFFLLFYLLGASVKDGDVPVAVAWGRLLSTVLIAGLTLWLVRKVVTLRAKVDRQYLGAAVRYGWKANLTSTLTYLNHRVDLIVLMAIKVSVYSDQNNDIDEAKRLAGIDVAYYSMAVTWAELVWHFPEAMRDLFFSKVASSSHEEARQLTPVLARLGLLFSLLGAVAIVLLIDPVMGLITWAAHGSSATWFDDWSVDVGMALWLLVPGTVGFTVSKVLQADLAARNHLQTCINAQVAVLVVMLGFDVWLIPEHGALGAAIASTIAYTVGTIWTVITYCAQANVRIWECLFVQPKDFRYIRDIFGAVINKLRRKRS